MSERDVHAVTRYHLQRILHDVGVGLGLMGSNDDLPVALPDNHLPLLISRGSCPLAQLPEEWLFAPSIRPIGIDVHDNRMGKLFSHDDHLAL